jgi:hypothetical protein
MVVQFDKKCLAFEELLLRCRQETFRRRREMCLYLVTNDKNFLRVPAAELMAILKWISRTCCECVG